MIAQLKSLHCPDVLDLISYVPERADWNICIEATVGPVESDGGDIFSFEICSPAWVSSEVEKSGAVAGRHKLIVESFDYNKIRDQILKFISSSSGDTWQDVAQKLSRWGYWEFEDYVE